nr:MAG TPA: hypothetical protein [Caudoviricetes sp.]
MLLRASLAEYFVNALFLQKGVQHGHQSSDVQIIVVNLHCTNRVLLFNASFNKGTSSYTAPYSDSYKRTRIIDDFL